MRVDLTVTLGGEGTIRMSPRDRYRAVGVVPVGNLQGWVDPNDDRPAPKGVQYPFAQVGQRVSFFASRGKGQTVVRLRYFARS